MTVNKFHFHKKKPHIYTITTEIFLVKDLTRFELLLHHHDVYYIRRVAFLTLSVFFNSILDPAILKSHFVCINPRR